VFLLTSSPGGVDISCSTTVELLEDMRLLLMAIAPEEGTLLVSAKTRQDTVDIALILYGSESDNDKI